MTKYAKISLVLIILLLLLIAPVSSTAHSSDAATKVALKYDNGLHEVSEAFVKAIGGKPVKNEFERETVERGKSKSDSEKDLINVLAITKDGETYSKNIQTPPVSNVYVASRTRQDTDVMQTTVESGYPVLEIYWGYEKSDKEPWQYYMRVNSLNDGYAVYSDFKTKIVWRKSITSAEVTEIISNGDIPPWSSDNLVGGY